VATVKKINIITVT